MIEVFVILLVTLGVVAVVSGRPVTGGALIFLANAYDATVAALDGRWWWCAFGGVMCALALGVMACGRPPSGDES